MNSVRRLLPSIALPSHLRKSFKLTNLFVFFHVCRTMRCRVPACAENGRCCQRSAVSVSQALRTAITLGMIILAHSKECLSGSSCQASQSVASMWNAGSDYSRSNSTVRAAASSVAIVNEAVFHLEIMAGFIEILSRWDAQLTVYAQWSHKVVASAQLEHFFGGTIPAVTSELPTKDTELALHDLVVFVSPEYRPQITSMFYERAPPKAALALIHNGAGQWFKKLSKHPQLRFAALSPHVAEFCMNKTSVHVDWLLPVATYREGNCSTPPAAADNSEQAKCNDGICVQGNFSGSRRNYTLLWEFLEKHAAACNGSLAPVRRSLQAACSSESFKVHMVGRGDRSELRVPDSISHLVHLHENLAAKAFYQRIHGCRALLPLFASDSYLKSKFSSTIISSLISGTPIVSGDEIMRSYKFLPDTATFAVTTGGELELLSSLVQEGTEPKIWSTRAALTGLKDGLNKHASEILMRLMIIGGFDVDLLDGAPAVDDDMPAAEVLGSMPVME